MDQRLTRALWVVLTATIATTASGEDDRNLKFCGTWQHGYGPLKLNVNLTTGCDKIVVFADQSVLHVVGQITAQCVTTVSIPLGHIPTTKNMTKFCVNWEPLIDQLKLKIAGELFSLCSPVPLKEHCCTHMSHGANSAVAAYGIANGSVDNDLISDKTREYYEFNGSFINCRETFCGKAKQGSQPSNKPDRIEENPCVEKTVLKLEDNGGGNDVTFTPQQGVQSEDAPFIHLPSALTKAVTSNNEVVCTHYRNNSLFQEDVQTKGKILNDVVSITIENEIIKDLPEPIKISFHHKVIPKTLSRKCVSWDTRKDPLKVNWSTEGCETQVKGEKHTECHCNHLTYFTVLVQLEPKPVRHLLALTAITSLGCAVSLISCIALIVFLCRKSNRRKKELSVQIHLGLAVSLAILNLLFFFTGILANVRENVCGWMGAALHYALLSSLTWMGIEVFHTFWLVQVVFNPTPKPWIWNMVGFGAPAVPVIILMCIPDIYGLKEIHQADDPNPYKMCWMQNNEKALLAHYVTNMALLAVLVVSGLVMLVLVYREIRKRDEWRQNRVAFLSIWGLSCLFGTSWGLTFLDFGPLTDFILFVSCILNSFQGFLLMLRFYLLDWMRKHGAGSGLSSSSTGSTRHHMLRSQEKS